MPKRSNPFQKLVHQVERSLSPEARIEESVLIEGREVDLLIELESSGMTFRVAVECRDHKRSQDATWIDQLEGKFVKLSTPIHKVLAVSSSGFTSGAYSEQAKSSLDLELLTFQEAECADWGRFRLLKQEVEVIRIVLCFTREMDITAPPQNVPPGFLSAEPQPEQVQVMTESGEGSETLSEFLVDRINQSPELREAAISEVSQDLPHPTDIEDSWATLSVRSNYLDEDIRLRDSRGVQYKLRSIVYPLLGKIERTTLSLGEALYRGARVFSGAAEGSGREISIALVEQEGKEGVDASIALTEQEHDYLVEWSELPLQEATMDLVLFAFADELIDAPDHLYENPGSDELPDDILAD